MLVSQAHANTLKYAFQGPLNQLDPYSLNETFTLTTLSNVYEGLIRRGPDLKIEPALAESWEMLEPTRWRFYLRKGVSFHNGNAFTADDVAFSADRIRSAQSGLTDRLDPAVKVDIVDDYTVDFISPTPNPILYYNWSSWFIMDKEWAEENKAVDVTSASDKNQNFAAFHANGTGPFRIVEHEAGVRTIFKKYEAWWDTPEHNLSAVEFIPVLSSPTRVAALLSSELDLIYPVPVQDLSRIEANEGTRTLTGPELRTIFLGMDQYRDELLYSNIKGKNPFKDNRVRQAVMLAIDIDTIKKKIMRTQSTPSALMISPYLFSGSTAFNRPRFDPGRARSLLREAGYENGFSVELDCPNDRYVNDEAICQAVVSYLAHVGIDVTLNAQPRSKFFAKVLAPGGYDTSFYLLGWTPSSFDSYNVLHSLHSCRSDTGEGSPFNLGGYCNEKVDELAAQILSQNDIEKRNALITQAYELTTMDFAYVPLHQQRLAWGISDKVSVKQRADNGLIFNYVTIDN
ncbi:MAG: ABC transporter substrate-binding protein [Stappiaceae bacterium]